MVQTVSDSSRYFVINPTEGPHLGKYICIKNNQNRFDAIKQHCKRELNGGELDLGRVEFCSKLSLEYIVTVFYFQNLPFLGLGFGDRSDSFDFNMALSDHFKGLRVDFEIAKEEEEPRELLDLSLKEGQTIKVGNKLGDVNQSTIHSSGTLLGFWNCGF